MQILVSGLYLGLARVLAPDETATKHIHFHKQYVNNANVLISLNELHLGSFRWLRYKIYNPFTSIPPVPFTSKRQIETGQTEFDNRDCRGSGLRFTNQEV